MTSSDAFIPAPRTSLFLCAHGAASNRPEIWPGPRLARLAPRIQEILAHRRPARVPEKRVLHPGASEKMP